MLPLLHRRTFFSPLPNLFPPHASPSFSLFSPLQIVFSVVRLSSRRSADLADCLLCRRVFIHRSKSAFPSFFVLCRRHRAKNKPSEQRQLPPVVSTGFSTTGDRTGKNIRKKALDIASPTVSSYRLGIFCSLVCLSTSIESPLLFRGLIQRTLALCKLITPQSASPSTRCLAKTPSPSGSWTSFSRSSPCPRTPPTSRSRLAKSPALSMVVLKIKTFLESE